MGEQPNIEREKIFEAGRTEPPQAQADDLPLEVDGPGAPGRADTAGSVPDVTPTPAEPDDALTLPAEGDAGLPVTTSADTGGIAAEAARGPVSPDVAPPQVSDAVSSEEAGAGVREVSASVGEAGADRDETDAGVSPPEPASADATPAQQGAAPTTSPQTLGVEMPNVSGGADATRLGQAQGGAAGADTGTSSTTGTSFDQRGGVGAAADDEVAQRSRADGNGAADLNAEGGSGGDEGDVGAGPDDGHVRTGPETSSSVKYSQEITSPEDEPEREGRSLATTHHEVIKQWAEERGGTPATVEGTEHGDHLGVLRLDFSGDNEKLRHVSWDEWFHTFDVRQLNFIYQEHRRDGRQSNFFRLESPDREDG